MYRVATVITLLLSLSCYAAVQDVGEARVPTSIGWELQAQNNGTSSIVALHASFRCPKRQNHPKEGLDVQMDTLLSYGHDKAVLPGKTYAIRIPEWAVDCPGGIDAVLFSDGHSVGEPAAVNDVFGRRRGVHEALGFAVKQLDAIESGSADPIHVAEVLKSRSQAVSHDSSIPVAESEGQMITLSSVAHNLETQYDRLVPSDSTSHHQPRIEDVMRDMKLSRQQAHAHVIKSKLQEWDADLDGNMQPPESVK